MRAVAVPGRWIWGLSGLAAAAALAIPGTRLVTMNEPPWPSPQPAAVTVRTVTVPQPVTAMIVKSYGGQVRVAAGRVSRVQVTERIVYDPRAGGPPAVSESVSGGRLALSDPACAGVDCSVGFSVIVPSGLAVTVLTQGGPAAVSGTGTTDVSSAGGPVQAARIAGSLTVRTGGGALALNGVTGTLRADTSGGPVAAGGITAATAIVTSGGGPAQVAFSVAPHAVMISSDGGPALLRVPGGPYALTADSDGGPELIGIATDPAARISLTITSGGGPLQVQPASRPGSPGAA